MKARSTNILFALAIVFLFVPTASASSGGATLDTADIAFFQASFEGHLVRLSWETFSEEDARGFNVYRAERIGGPRTKLNDSLIAARFPGSYMGAAYELADNTGRPRILYHYWLEVVDHDLNAVEHGPVSAHVTSSIQSWTSSLVPSGDWLYRISVQP
jgi:hypothetical protein